MQRTISVYQNVMINKIINSQTHFEVLGIIDKKIDLINEKECIADLKNQFLENVITKLKKTDVSKTEPGQWSNIRVALDHLKNLRQHR